ncbi:MAG: type II secretion system F family protein [Acidimicrobiales bacterium]|nr:type II secretion system F family protein [Acidimicrobiales bacterium]
MPRRGRLALAVAFLSACLGALLFPFAASGQADDNMLAVRSVDATNRKAVAITFLYTGSPDDLKQLAIRENGELMKVNDLSPIQAEGRGRSLATVYVVDLSASMERDGVITEVKKGLSDVFSRIPKGDEAAIVSFSDAVVVESPFTSDQAQLNEALDEMVVPEDGKAALWEGVKKAATLFGSRPDLQPNIVVISDSKNDAGSVNAEAARATVINSGAAFFTVEIDHDGGTETSAFSQIMDRTGGAAFKATKGTEVSQAVKDVASTTQSQFVATYESRETQGQVDVSVAVGAIERQASYVAGAQVQGAAAGEVIPPPKPFGPAFLRGAAGGALALVLVGLAVGLGAYSIGLLITKSDDSLSAVLSPYSDGPVQSTETDGALAQTAILQRAVEMTEEFAERQGFLTKVEGALERANLPLRAAEAMFFFGVGVILLALVGFFLGGLIPGVIIVVLSVLIPPAVVNFMASRRAKKFQSLLPDTLQLLSGSLRAGYSLLQGVEAVSKEVGEPMGQELRRVITEARLGREVEDAMEAVAERMDSADFAWAVMAIRIQREVGGNLSELLMTVADTMIHRERLRRDISALTAEGKLSAMILGLLPVGLGAFMWMSNPEYMAPLAETGMGNFLLLVALISGLIGFAWMKKIINIKI